MKNLTSLQRLPQLFSFLVLGACASSQNVEQSCPFECPCCEVNADQDCETCPAETPCGEHGVEGHVAEESEVTAEAWDPLQDPRFYATMWTQTAVEYETDQIQTWRLAAMMMERALEDNTWTAAPVEQLGDFSELPPAVIVDVDETVLDNSPYQAWSMLTGEAYSNDTWNAWCNEAAAEPVPGFTEFEARANELGVKIFYVSNRYAATEAATIENLNALGFECDSGSVLLRDEFDAGSLKGTRRTAVAETHRILLLAGDNFGDFTDVYKVSPEERVAEMEANMSYWGERWIVLPNPQYGSWWSSYVPYTLGEQEQHDAALEALNPWGGPDNAAE